MTITTIRRAAHRATGRSLEPARGSQRDVLFPGSPACSRIPCQ
jgi:hypothetical protein